VTEATVAVSPFVRRTRDPRGVIRLVLDRPQSFNVLSEGMLAALQAELDAVAGDESARVVVIAAEGKAFCAGHDLKQMRAEPSKAYYEALFAQCARVMLTIQRLPVPVIACVQGIATAAGCQLVAACDLAVAASDARFAVSGVSLGLFCSSPSVALSRNLQRKAAFEMLVTGEFVSADEAKAKGHTIKVGKFPFAALGRALSVNDTEGFAKTVIDAKTGELLGLHIVANGAGDLISEGALAIEMGAVADDLRLTIHPHPTLSEAVMESAAAALGEAVHIINR